MFISYIFRLFLVINSLSLSFVIFAINKKIVIEWIDPYCRNVLAFINSENEFIGVNIDNLLHMPSYIIYFIVVLGSSSLSIFLIRYLSDDSIEKNTLTNIEPANDAFLPGYLGYFFVALSVPDIKIFFLVFGIISILIFSSRISYFNPIFFLFRFNFYYVINSNNVKILLITKQELKKTKDIEFTQLKRITNYTFIDISKKERA